MNNRSRTIWTDIWGRAPWIRMLLVALLASLGDGGGLASAGEPVIRSLGDAGNRPVDELNLPRFRDRASHRGWEVRTDQIVVFCTTSREDAQLVSREVQAAWAEIGKLADQWSDVHRQPAFAVGAVAVLVDNEPVRRRDEPLSALRVLSDTTMIYLNVAPGEPPLESQLPKLRRTTVHAFLHVSEQDRTLPPWVRHGLAGYITGDHPTSDPRQGVAPPKAPPSDRGETLSRRLTPSRLVPRRTDRQLSTTWMRYLIEGDDARHAPALFASLRDTLRQAEQVPPSTRATRRGFEPTRRTSVGRGPHHVEDLVRRSDLEDRIGDWIADSDVDQPLYEPAADVDPQLEERQREMLLILKLVRRFAAPFRRSIQPRITEFQPDGQRELRAGTTGDRPVDLENLYDRLTRGAMDPWATLDIDGSLLLSTDRARLAELFGLRDGRYAAQWQDGRFRLDYRWSDRNVLQAWLEENREKPRRPLARFQMSSSPKSPWALKSDAPKSDQ